uniref:Reverse transcriptase Ty1/copia-type domain-containing protein n=1 Tax=Physcomitrium patens TaxID=3218 RepID=A0A2K1JXR1_PHYPA|nr:hypothetical protein PHYPA_013435 [Physcomitrium patens]
MFYCPTNATTYVTNDSRVNLSSCVIKLRIWGEKEGDPLSKNGRPNTTTNTLQRNSELKRIYLFLESKQTHGRHGSALHRQNCSVSNTCIYHYWCNGEFFNTTGDLAFELVTLSGSTIPGIAFGCGRNQQGSLPYTNGFIGMVLGPLSIPSQLSSSTAHAFSYSKNLQSNHLWLLELLSKDLFIPSVCRSMPALLTIDSQAHQVETEESVPPTSEDFYQNNNVNAYQVAYAYFSQLKINSVDSGSSKMKWSLGSGASNHITGNQCVFSSVRPSTGLCVRCARGHSHPVTAIVRYKARLVSRDFHQQHGFDYQEIFALVVRWKIIRLVATTASHNKWPIQQLDVQTTFINDHLKEEVYLQQPPGFAVLGHEHLVYRLHCSL